MYLCKTWSKQWCSWLRHCATSWEVAGFVFSLTYPSGCTMALGLTVLLTNEYQSFFLGGKGSQCVRVTTLPLSCASCLEIWWASTSWNPQSLYRNCFTYTCIKQLLSLSAFSFTATWIMHSKGKAVPLQAWSGPDGSRKLRFPDFMTTAQDGGKVVSLMHRPPLPPGNTPGTHFC